jgi:hypothetical protein
MSFDFSDLPTKTEFQNSTPSSVNTLAEQMIYDSRKSSIQSTIVKYFTRTGGYTENSNYLNIRVGFLTTDDKTALVNAIESKGFSCTENNGIMTIN